MILELLAASGSGASANRPFSSRAYTGNGGVQTINTGVDAGSGAIAMAQSLANRAYIYDTVRPSTALGELKTNEVIASSLVFDGINRVVSGNLNTAATSYYLWSFARLAGFCDLITFGTGGSPVAHALAESPKAFVAFKRTGSSLTAQPLIWAPGDTWFINGGSTDDNPTPFTSISSTHVTPDNTAPNNIFSAGRTFACMLFGTAAGRSEVGTWTGDGAGARAISLGLAPAWTMVWEADDVGSNPQTAVYDVRLGAVVPFSSTVYPAIDTSGATLNVDTTFNVTGVKYRYLAIR